MRVNFQQLIKYCGTLTDPATVIMSIGLPADPAFGEGRRAGALFFARHLDYFIMTQNSQPSPGLGTVKTIYRDQTTSVHLPGLAKNAAPRHPSLTLWAGSRQLIKPPGHLWSVFCRTLRKKTLDIKFLLYI